MLQLLNLIAATKLTPINPVGLPNRHGVGQNELQTILSILFSVLGALAFLIIVIAGLRYVTSAGSPEKAAHARNTIILALAGLAIAIIAQAIVAFVIKRV